MASDKLDAQIEQKSATKELYGLLRRTFELDAAESAPLAQVREQLARQVLLTDLIKGLAGAVPTHLASVKVAHSPAGIDACLSLARVWRLRRDVRETYVAAANKVEQEFSLAQVDFDPERVVDLETFLALDRMVQRHVEQSLIESPSDALLELAQSRLARFWSDVEPPVQARWSLVAAAAKVLLEADGIAKALKKAPATIPSLVKAYTDGDSPWCLLDTYHRQMESRWFNFEPELGEGHDGLDKLIHKAEQRYTEIGSELAKHFVERYQKAKHPVKGLLRQVEVFESLVKPRLDQDRERQPTFGWMLYGLRWRGNCAESLRPIAKSPFSQ